MDVRCEKCQTEYELDESKLKPGGVTVKCTTCGHMFKVRRRHPTAVSTPAPPAGSEPVRFGSLADNEEADRTWLIRLEDGEIKTCRELSTLQKWIVSGRVTRSCAISRTGKKWKQLGEIGELASFFSIADEAREARATGSMSGTATVEYPAIPPSDPGGASHPRTIRRSSASGAAAGGSAAAGGAPQGGPPAGASPNDTFMDPPKTGAGRAVGGGGAVGKPGAGPLPFSQTLPLGSALPAGAGGGRAGSSVPASPSMLHESDDAPTISSPEASAQLARDAEAAEERLLGARASATGPAAGGESGPVYGQGGEPGAPVYGGGASAPVYGGGAAGGVASAPVYGGGAAGGDASGPAYGQGAAPGAGPRTFGGSPPGPGGVPRQGASSGYSGPVATGRGAGGGHPAGPSTAGWAAQGRVGLVDDEGGPSGPVGGMARRASGVADAAFVSGDGEGRRKMPEIRGEYENGRFVPTDLGEPMDEEPLLPPKSRAGLWLVLGSLVVLGGAGAALWYFVLRPGSEQVAAPAAVAADAAPAAVAEAPSDAGAAATAAPTDTLEQVPAALAADTRAGLEEVDRLLEQALGAAPPAGPGGAAALVARARVVAARAQLALDESALATEPAAGKKAAAEARRLAGVARGLAEQALAIEANSQQALVAQADARRLAGDRTIEVERLLRQARQTPMAPELAREADLVQALLHVRDERLRDARVLLDRLAKNAPDGDVRARYRLAWIDHLDKNAAPARTSAEAVLAAVPEHEGARALLDRMAAADKPADKPAEKPADKPADKPDRTGGGSSSGGEDSLDTLLDRANKAAENGKCTQAMPLFRKVLDANPASVEALTGLGYCHMDRKEFASAHTRFRAALGISSRYQPAMWGIAEAYQQQGLKDQAIERYRAFLEAHPGSSKAAAARRQIERLGGSGSGGSGGSGSGGSGTDDSGGGSGTDDSGGGGEDPGGEDDPGDE